MAFQPSRSTLAALLLIGIALAFIAAQRAGDDPGDGAPDARRFAEEQYQRCMRGQTAPEPMQCALRTIQLASALHGQRFADLVAERLR